jgi:hypothetical protein
MRELAVISGRAQAGMRHSLLGEPMLAEPVEVQVRLG